LKREERDPRAGLWRSNIGVGHKVESAKETEKECRKEEKSPLSIN
jgi:hypothetical protein